MMIRNIGRGVWISLGLFAAVVIALYASIALLQQLALNGAGPAGSAGKLVGLLRINGGIYDATEAIEVLGKLRRDKRVKALLVRIDSPGGTVAPTQEIFEEINRFRATGRKVVASLGSVAASGGYYIALSADKIYANPGTITGSIGVVMVLPNAENVIKNLGLKINVIKSAPHKDLGSPLRSLVPRERDILQRLVDDTYGQFLRAVASRRKLSMKEAKRLGDGSIFSGERAKSVGLVDELGTRHDAVLEAGRLAGIEGEPKILDLAPDTSILGLVSRFLNFHLGWFRGGGLTFWGQSPAILQYMWKLG